MSSWERGFAGELGISREEFRGRLVEAGRAGAKGAMSRGMCQQITGRANTTPTLGLFLNAHRFIYACFEGRGRDTAQIPSGSTGPAPF